tara:strand:+ start:648 stop:995 length:348 start_codon:yes stop_codon:yes gene_type:complete
MTPIIVYVKKGADIRFLRQELTDRLHQIATVFIYHSPAGFRFVVTSGNDSKHSVGSLHYINCAVDARIKYWPNGVEVYLTDNEQGQIKTDLDKVLGPDWDIVIESTHIHIEWDPT